MIIIAIVFFVVLLFVLPTLRCALAHPFKLIGYGIRDFITYANRATSSPVFATSSKTART